MEKREYWANPKIYKRTLYFGLSFVTLFPPYAIYSIGASIPAIGFVLLISTLSGGYFLHVYRKYKNSPVIVYDATSITIQDPFSKNKTIELASIKSVKQASNSAIILKLEGLFKSSRINGKVLRDEDRNELVEYLSANIKNTNK